MKNKVYWCLFLMVSFGYATNAQGQKPLFEQLIEEKKSSVDALVLYPADIRESILKVCAHPEALVRLDRIQQWSSDSFREVIRDFSQREQKQFYDLVRHPNLVYRLVEGGHKSREEIEEILKDYPKEIHDASIKRGRKSYGTLQEIESLNTETQQAFNTLLSGYEPDTRQSVQALIAHPEILSILTKDLDVAILVGDLYSKDPDMVLHKADSLQKIVAEEQARELEGWKKELENDSRVLAEMDNAGRDFARENDYNLAKEPVDETNVSVHFYPYSYWYGYPHWYTYPYWYPYPYWYHTGFYYSNAGNVVVIGLPSFYYTWWFYRHPRRYYYLDRHYWRHYDRHPHSHSSFRRGMRITRNSQSYRPIRESERNRNISTGRGRQIIRTPQRTPQHYNRQRASEHHRSTWQPRSRVQSGRSRSPGRTNSKPGSVRRRTNQK